MLCPPLPGLPVLCLAYISFFYPHLANLISQNWHFTEIIMLNAFIIHFHIVHVLLYEYCFKKMFGKYLLCTAHLIFYILHTELLNTTYRHSQVTLGCRIWQSVAVLISVHFNLDETKLILAGTTMWNLYVLPMFFLANLVSSLMFGIFRSLVIFL